MPNELAELSELLDLVTSPQQLHQELKLTDWSADLVKWLPPVEGTAPAVWFHKVADLIIQHGVQPQVIALLRPPRLGRAGDFDRYCAKWIAPGGDQGPSDDHAAAGQTDAVTPRASASPPPSAQAAHPTPAAPPAIPRRWLPPNAVSTDSLSQHLARLRGHPVTPTAHPDALLTADLIHHRALILLGESGAGKSFELDQLKRMEVPLGAPLSLNAGTFTGAHALREQLLGFCRATPHAAPRFLYLDALDEDKTEGQRLGDELAATLESLNLAERTNLWIRVTSRTASWSAALGQRLTTLLGPEAPLKVLMLQPLSEDEAALVAATEYEEASPEEAAERGRAEVARARRLDMQALTMSPLTLKLLCAANLQKDTVVTRAQLFERGIQRLLKEARPGMAPDRRELKRNEAQKHAAWFAALSTLAGRSPIPMDDWPTGLDMDTLAERLGEDTSALRRVLTTPLFDDASGRGYEARRFVHQSFAEWLTARWILTQGSTEVGAGDKWRARLTLPGGGIPPQLAGVVSWLVCMDEPWRGHVLAEDIWLVITPDFPSYSPELRRTVFRSLIDVAKSGTEDNFYGRLHNHADALSLSGAEDTLCDAMARLTPQEANATGLLIILVAMWTLISLDAGQRVSPGASALINALVQLGLDHDRVGYARSEIAVGALVFALSLTRDRAPIPRSSATRWWDAAVSPLYKLLDHPTPPIELSEDDEVAYSGRVAYTLDLLYPRGLTAEKLFRTLHLPEGDIIGQYERFLRTELPAISNTYTPLIPPLLRWWTEQMSRVDPRELHRYGENAWTVAWEHRGDASIWPALVENFYALLVKGVAPSGLTIDQHDRRRLLLALWNLHHRRADTNEALYERLQQYEWDRANGGDLLTVQDIGWWVEQYGRGEAAMREEITTTINRVCMRNNPDALLELLHAVRQLPQEDERSLSERIRAQLDLAELVERGEPIPAIVRHRDEDEEERQRPREAKRQERRDVFVRAIPPSDPPAQAWKTMFDAVVAGGLSLRDVTKHEFFSEISADVRAQVLQRAREYLEASPEHSPDDYAVRHNFIRRSGKVGVAALLTLAEFAPSQDLGLTDEAWARWTLTYLQCSGGDLSSLPLGPAQARVESLPDTALHRLFEELCKASGKEAAEYLVRLAWRGRPIALKQELQESFEAGLTEEAEEAVLVAFTRRADAAGEVAREAARQRLCEGPRANPGRWHKAGLALWESTTLTETDQDLLLGWLDDKERLRSLGKRYEWFGMQISLARFTPPRLAELYRRACHHLAAPPASSDPTAGDGGGGATVTPDVKARSLILGSIVDALSELKTPSAADALEELGRDYNNAELIQRAELMRRELQRANWRPPSIEDLLAFAPRRS